MDFKTYRELYLQAGDYKDFDLYVMERGWQDWMEEYAEEDNNADRIVAVMDFIYKAYRCNAKELCKLAGIKMTTLTELIGVNYRTVQRWASGEIDFPAHIKLLTSYALFTMIFDKKEDEMYGKRQKRHYPL